MSWPFNSPNSFNGGFWTTKQGSLDWCEENYVHSPYIAETFNTLSNLAYIVLSLHGIRNCLQEGLPRRFAMCNLSLLCVGLGSASYHATLRNWAQAFDEVPMLYTVGFITYTVLDIAPASNKRHLLPAAMLAVAITWTFAYTRIPSPLFHELSFTLLLLLTTVRVLLLLRTAHPTRARALYYEGAALFASGFAAWVLDSAYCATLRAWRSEAGWPATWLAQGHAYWHVATAMGAYRMIVASEVLFLVGRDAGKGWVVRGRVIPVARRVET